MTWDQMRERLGWPKMVDSVETRKLRTGRDYGYGSN